MNIDRVSHSANRAANCSAAQQVIPSLSKQASLPGCQKSKRFVCCLGVLIAPENFANPIGVCSELVNDIRVGNALQAHHMGCNSLGERKCASLKSDDIHLDTCDRVSFVWGVFPKQVSHVGFSFRHMVGRIAKGTSGFVPAILWFRALHEYAGSSAGVATANRRPGTHIIECGTIYSQPLPLGISHNKLGAHIFFPQKSGCKLLKY